MDHWTTNILAGEEESIVCILKYTMHYDILNDFVMFIKLCLFLAAMKNYMGQLFGLLSVDLKKQRNCNIFHINKGNQN